MKTPGYILAGLAISMLLVALVLVSSAKPLWLHVMRYFFAAIIVLMIPIFVLRLFRPAQIELSRMEVPSSAALDFAL